MARVLRGPLEGASGEAFGGCLGGFSGVHWEVSLGGALGGALGVFWTCLGRCLDGRSGRSGGVEKVSGVKIALYGFRLRFLDGIRTVILFSLHGPSAPGLPLYGIRPTKICPVHFFWTDSVLFLWTDSVLILWTGSVHWGWAWRVAWGVVWDVNLGGLSGGISGFLGVRFGERLGRSLGGILGDSMGCPLGTYL